MEMIEMLEALNEGHSVKNLFNGHVIQVRPNCGISVTSTDKSNPENSWEDDNFNINISSTFDITEDIWAYADEEIECGNNMQNGFYHAVKNYCDYNYLLVDTKLYVWDIQSGCWDCISVNHPFEFKEYTKLKLVSEGTFDIERYVVKTVPQICEVHDED